MKMINRILGVLFFLIAGLNTYGQDLSFVKKEMVDLFEHTLKQNYTFANSTAILNLMDEIESLMIYNTFAVDREKMKEINGMLIDTGLLDYFFGYYEQQVDFGDMDYSNIVPYHIAINNPFLIKQDGNTYFQKELQQSDHLFLKDIASLYKSIGFLPFSACWKRIRMNVYDCLDDFKTNEEIRLFMTLFFWRHLCCCANLLI